MGGGGSKNYDQTPRSVEIAQYRRRMVEQVERFVVNVYASCSRVEAMWLILSSKLGQKAFETFVRLEESDAVLGIFLATSDVLSGVDLTWETVLSHIQLLQPQLTDRDSPVADLLPELFRNEFLEDFATMEGAGNVKLLLTILQRLQNELVLIMARDLFNRFIMSKHYKTWRAAEASHAIATTVEDTSQSNKTDVHSATLQVVPTVSSNKSVNSQKRSNSRNGVSRSSILRRSLSRLSVTRMSQGTMLRFRMRSVVAPQDLSASAFSQIKGDELQSLLRRRENWLASLVAAVEGLPVAFCLASCKRPSRPLIFVNKFFEKTTGFNRDDILGRSLGDLLLLHSNGVMHTPSPTNEHRTSLVPTFIPQDRHSEDSRTRQLRESLQQCRANVSVLDNKTADEKDFKCLSVLKPVFSVSIEEHHLFCDANNNLNLNLINGTTGNNCANNSIKNNTNVNANNASGGSNKSNSANNTSCQGTSSLQPLYIMALLFDVSREVDSFVSKSALASDLMALLPDVLLYCEDDGEFDDEDGEDEKQFNNSSFSGRSYSGKQASKSGDTSRFCIIS